MESNTSNQEVFFDGAKLAWEEVAPGLERQIMGYDDKVMLVNVKFEAGAVGAMHSHHHSQVSYVTSGKFEMTIGDQKKILQTGDSFYVPPHVMHGCVCLEAGCLVDVFSPQREDFLE